MEGVSQENWCARVANGIHGLIFGFILFFGSMGLLGWNEGNFVHTRYDINAARLNGVGIDCTNLKSGAPASVLPRNALLHFTCPLNLTQAVVSDPAFPMISVNHQLFMTRSASMCQWSVSTSTKKNSAGGGTTTVCKMNSMGFSSSYTSLDKSCQSLGADVSPRAKQGFQQYFAPLTYYATGVTVSTEEEVRRRRLISNGSYTSHDGLGVWPGVDFNVPQSLLQELKGKAGDNDCTFQNTCGTAGSACQPFNLRSLTTRPPYVSNGFLFYPDQKYSEICWASAKPDPSTGFQPTPCDCAFDSYDPDDDQPDVGNIKIAFAHSTFGGTPAATPANPRPKPGDSVVSVLATIDASNKNLAPFKGKKGTAFYRLQKGVSSLAEILDCMQKENEEALWTGRIVGFLVMWIGLVLIFRLPAVFADAIPCVGPMLGDLIEGAVCCFTCPIATALTLFIIGIAWLFFRPKIAALLLASAIAVSALGVMAGRYRKRGAGGGGLGDKLVYSDYNNV